MSSSDEKTLPDQIAKERFFILFLTFVCGGVTLGVEIAASRLLAPSFGTSMLVWSAIIGLMLIYLTFGYTLGGRLADRYPQPKVLYRSVAIASLLVALVPFISRPIVQASATNLAGFEMGILSGSFLAVILLFAVPITLLGMVSPFAIRLLMVEVPSAGTTSGQIYALSTLGSFVGTFVPPLWLIPSYGTRNTFLLMGGTLLILSLVGLWRVGSRKSLGIYLTLAVLLGGFAFTARGQAVKPVPGLLYETESAYNFIQVVQHRDEIHLKLNEGGAAIQSAYRIGGGNPRGDFFTNYLVGPLFREDYKPEEITRVLIIGGAAGTLGKLFTRYYGPIHVDQVEIDPKIVEAGIEYFDMTEENVITHVDDGRSFLARRDDKYDVIVIDAYRVPYLPFHLTTKEFFALVGEHLEDDGVVVSNVLSFRDDPRLVDGIGSSMAAVFPTVFLWEPDLKGQGGIGNSQLFATRSPSTLKAFNRNIKKVEDNWLRRQTRRKFPSFRPFKPKGELVVFTDDYAPVEDILHSMIFRLASAEATANN